MPKDPARRFWTIPNVLSLSRLALLPVFFWLMSQPEGKYWLWGGVLIVYGMISDILDGFLARKLGQITKIGKLLDPLADKITAGALAIFCVVQRGMPLEALLITVVRDLALLIGGRLLWRKGGEVPTSIFLGKIAALLWALNLLCWTFEWQPPAAYLLWPAVGFYVFTGVLYARRVRQISE
jgi:CDP-diacylglycerol--glycerol-3-phosphate 3-phosphatidyltransferase